MTGLLKRIDIACPWMGEDIFRARFQALGDETLKIISPSGTVTIEHGELACSGSAWCAYSGIHLIGIQLAAFLVESRPAHYLFPVLNAGDTFHITENNNSHAYSLSHHRYPFNRNLPCTFRCCEKK